MLLFIDITYLNLVVHVVLQFITVFIIYQNVSVYIWITNITWVYHQNRLFRACFPVSVWVIQRTDDSQLVKNILV